MNRRRKNSQRRYRPVVVSPKSFLFFSPEFSAERRTDCTRIFLEIPLIVVKGLRNSACGWL